jgi:hypothetical protein
MTATTATPVRSDMAFTRTRIGRVLTIIYSTSTAFVASYLQKNWLPLFEDEKYFMKHQALLITFDESETCVWSIGP